MPLQINTEKLKHVDGAVAIGVIGTVATPFLIGGAVATMGIAQIGVAVQALEAIKTITRVTMSFPNL